jgi:hypothetical protein
MQPAAAAAERIAPDDSRGHRERVDLG